MKKVKPKKLLVITHDTARAGAPLLLFGILNWLKENTNFQFVILARNGGDLLEKFRSMGELYLLKSKKCELVQNEFFNPFIKVAWLVYQKLKQVIIVKYVKLKLKGRIDLIYSNTVTNTALLNDIKKSLKVRSIVHVHEGEKLLIEFNRDGSVSKGLNENDLVIAVSESVKQTLESLLNVKTPIKVIPGGLDVSFKLKEQHRSLLSRFGVCKEDKIIMCCAYPSWHKGIDFFLQISRIILNLRDDVYMVWIGGFSDNNIFAEMQYDIDKLEISNKVLLIPQQSNIMEYINLCDIFLTLSRSESFSLVTIEAGLAEKPVLCFEGSGGPCEIVACDDRFIVPYADVNMMAQRINALLDDKVQCIEMGRYLHNRIVRNYDVDKISREVMLTLNELISKR